MANEPKKDTQTPKQPKTVKPLPPREVTKEELDGVTGGMAPGDVCLA